MNIESFLIYIATPFLAIFTLLFIYLAKKASLIDKKSEDHIKTEDQRFEYKQKEFRGIDNKMDSLKSSISTDIIHPLKEVNEKISAFGIEATLKNLMKLFDEQNQYYQQIADDTIYYPVSFDELKVTFLLTIDTKRQLVLFQAFCKSFEEINENVFELINEFNNSTIVGHLELNNFEGKFVPIYNYALLFDNNKISNHNIQEVIRYFGASLNELFNDKKVLKLNIVTFLFDDYLKLQLGEKKYKELVDNSDKKVKVEKEKKQN